MSEKEFEEIEFKEKAMQDWIKNIRDGLEKKLPLDNLKLKFVGFELHFLDEKQEFVCSERLFSKGFKLEEYGV